MLGLILLQIALIVLNAIFAGTEIAVISVNETKLEREVERGNKRTKRLLAMTRNSSKIFKDNSGRNYTFRIFRRGVCV